jgi:4-amino-4-deoxychorismate lyase
MPDWYLMETALQEIAINDRAFQYGDGLFETVAIRKHEPRLWQYHSERLAKGCKALNFAMPTERELRSGLHHALQNSSIISDHCTVKIIVTAGAGVRGYGRSKDVSPTVYFGVFPSTPPALAHYRQGIETPICRTRLAVGSATAGLKTLNRLEQVLARSELTQSKQFEGLTMDADGNIICGTMSNVFFVSGNSISTPPLDRCGVAGVMRRHVIETLRANDRCVDVTVMPASLMQSIDELFVSNSQFGVIPVARCNNFDLGVGPVTKATMAMLAANGISECQV